MKKKYKLLLIIIFFIVYFLIYFNSKTLSMDEIWNYGFAYNISSGLVPYRDFNMIITPLYSYLLALLIIAFGNKYLIMIIFNAFLSSLLQYVFFSNHKWKSLILLPCITFVNFGGYNFLTLVLFVIFLNINKFRYQDFLAGIIVAMIILTKQTVGGLLFIVAFIYSKNKIKYLIGFLPLCLIFFGYLLCTKSLYSFLDYCLFGMFDFTGNSFTGINLTILFYFLLLGYLIYLNIKEKFRNQKLVYILVFQIISAPIFDITHVIVAAIPLLSYLLSMTKINKVNKYISLIIISFYSFIALFMGINIEMSSDEIYYYNDTIFYGKKMNTNLSLLHDLHDYIEKEYPNYHVYHLHVYAYLYKLFNGDTINKFDLINKGNMGYHGEEKYIKEINDDCINNKCLLIIEAGIPNNSQLSNKIQNYVKVNYQFVKNIKVMDIYTNT